MNKHAQASEFDRYMAHLCEALGHADRYAGFVDYSRGLMLLAVPDGEASEAIRSRVEAAARDRG
jgi:SRSO17 transposase